MSLCLRDFTPRYGTELYIDDVCHGTADNNNPDPVDLDARLSDRCLREHFSQLPECFLLMRRYHLTIQPGKFVLFATRVKFYGHVLMRGQRAPDPEKTAAVMRWDWCAIRTRTHMKAFLWFTQWYSLYVRGYAKLAAPVMESWRGPDVTKKQGKVCKASWKSRST